jgi:hypothetical protein
MLARGRGRINLTSCRYDFALSRNAKFPNDLSEMTSASQPGVSSRVVIKDVQYA